MLDINLIREEPDKVKEGINNKGAKPSIVDDFLEVDKRWRTLSQEIDNLRAERNKVTEEISSASSLSLRAERSNLIQKAKEIKGKINQISDEEKELQKKREELLLKIPNIPSSKAPIGKDESENVVVREEGKKPSFSFEPKSYIEIGEDLGLIDTKRAAKISGSRFNYLLKEAAMLEFGLVQLVFSTLIKKGFQPIVPPVLVKPEIMRKMGKSQFLEENDAFHIKEDDLYLVGSSEHTIGPFHMDEVLKGDELPTRYIGFSTCFRREAGSYGKDTKGILRVHQFDKLEMFSLTIPEESEKEHEFLLSCQEELLKSLELPYQVIDKCTGDMTWADSRQFDIETWVPSQGKYRETHSASNTTDFQARGVNIKYDKGGEQNFVHMLNATGFAIGRILIAILENHQTKEGAVKIPKALRKYTGIKEIK